MFFGSIGRAEMIRVFLYVRSGGGGRLERNTPENLLNLVRCQHLMFFDRCRSNAFGRCAAADAGQRDLFYTQSRKTLVRQRLARIS